eukprot:TRINITY_DN2524_c0_g1_i12.p1 TRINITY_DN2524_c0_g1~~TRINITY_DN2524_c0_g1_i12.p1  ORF type:complete len:405 (-),score=80.07 TRINITY_DN2524_c0_g1_i12:683-1897(-)
MLFPQTEVVFVVSATTNWGDTVGVVGNLPELGTWQCDSALLLHTEPHVYPKWTTSFLVPVGTQVEYKYIILTPKPSERKKYKLLKWESHQNRKILATGYRMAVEDGSFGGCGEAVLHIHQGWTEQDHQLRVKIGGYSSIDSEQGFSIEGRLREDFECKFIPLKKEHYLLGSNPFMEGEEYVFVAPKISDLSFCINVYEKGKTGKYARCVVTYEEMADLCCILVRPLVDKNLKVVGKIRMRCLVIRPFEHPDNNLNNLMLHHWKPHLDLIGHRGFGKSSCTFIAENTLLSFHTANKFGLKYIEFDVQVTSDGVPVIFHDWFVNTSTSSGGQPFFSPIGNLTLNQFKSLDVRHQNNSLWSEKHQTLKRSVSSPISVGNELARAKARIADKSFATLEQKFQKRWDSM